MSRKPMRMALKLRLKLRLIDSVLPAIVNVSIWVNTGLNILVRNEAAWVKVVHCFNHRPELAIKDAFNESAFYSNIDEMLSKLYWLYQKSPKRLTELKELSEVFEKSIPKPTKADGARWIDFKYRAMEKVLSNYGPYMTHLEQLAHTDSQPKKREEIKGFVNKLKDAGYLMHISIFIDILSPMRRLSLSLQRDKHDPVKVTRRLNEFTWTMSKLRLLIENSLDNDGDGQVKTCFKTFCSKVENDGGKFFYQGIKLSKYELTIERAKTVYTSAISTICTKVEQRFSSFTESVAFSNIPLLLDTSWPRNDSFSFRNREID